MNKKSNFIGSIMVMVLVFALIYTGFNLYQADQKNNELSNQLQVMSNRLRAENAYSSAPTQASVQPSEIDKSLPVMAVSSDGTGVLGKVDLRLIPGNSDVLIDTSSFLEPDTQYSANLAAQAAKKYTGDTSPDKDFVFTFEANSSLVGGPSAGAAMAVLSVSALENKQIRTDAAITGTISPNGDIGPVGGVYEKAQAAAANGIKLLLVPEGQAEVTSYDKETQPGNIGGISITRTYYVPKTMDLKEYAKQQWGMDVVEVSNLNQAVSLMIQ